jgi:peroxiredoxin
VQLTEISDQIEAMGISVVALTYDSVELLKTVKEDQGIQFTLLHDEDVSHVNAFGVRNLDYEPGHRVYGIPYPGIFLVDPNGVIKAKFAEERYQDRPPFEDVLEAAAKL